MTIKELIAELKKHDPKMDVAFSWDGGLSSADEGTDVESHFGKKVLVFSVSSYDSWTYENERDETVGTGDCKCKGLSHENQCPEFELPI